MTVDKSCKLDDVNEQVDNAFREMLLLAEHFTYIAREDASTAKRLLREHIAQTSEFDNVMQAFCVIVERQIDGLFE